MADIEKYKQLRKVIDAKLQELGFQELYNFEILLDSDDNVKILFRSAIDKRTLMSVDERELHRNFDDIVSSLTLDEKTENFKKDMFKDDWDI